MRKETYFVKDECENGMGRDPQEMSSGTCDPTMSVRGSGQSERKKEKKSITLVPPGDTFRLECLPEAVKRIRVKRAADFASDGIFDRVFYNNDPYHLT